MRLYVIPGLLSEQPIAYDDALHQLLVGLYQVPLTAMQYTLVMALVRQKQRHRASRGQEPLFVSVSELLQLTHLTRPEYVKQHLSRADEQLAPHAIVIGCLYGWGYGIFAATEVSHHFVAPPH